MKFFTTRHGAFGDFARSHFEVGGDDVLDSMRWWVDWNRRAQGFATITYRLEDLNEQILASLLEQLGEDDVERRARLAFERSARPLNTSVQRGHEVRPLAWSDLPVGPERDAVTQLALELGYPGAG